MTRGITPGGITGGTTTLEMMTTEEVMQMVMSLNPKNLESCLGDHDP